MKIKNIKVNAYGNLENKKIELSDNINIIYGKNEAGKSTLLKFITNIFYGTSKNKKGREYSDYDKYKPWNKEDFSGKISYKLDNGEIFEVYREFGKKNPKIYNSNLEDISKQFNIDKNTGNQFFYDQTKVDEEMFMSTFVSMQQEVKLNRQSQSNLIHKIANLAGTGEDNISYKKALDKLTKKQLDEIGTARSSEKPINIIEDNIKRLEGEKYEIINFEKQKLDIEKNKSSLEKEIENYEVENEVLNYIKKVNEKTRIENEKIKYNKEIIKKNNEKKEIEENNLKSILENKESLENRNKNYKKTKINNTKYSILFLIIFILNILNVTIIKNKIANYILITLIPILLLIYIINKNIIKNKNNKKSEIQKNKLDKINDEQNNKINFIKAEIKVIEKNNEEQKMEIEKIKNKVFLNINNEKENIKNKYYNKIEENKVSYYFNNYFGEDEEEYYNNDVKLNKEIEEINKKLNEKRIEKNKIEILENNNLEKLERLSNIEEKLNEYNEQYDELMKKNKSIILAKQLLEKAYEKMKNTVTPKFTKNLSNNIKKISNNKYNKITINDENGLMVELPNGEYTSAEKLSVGTIDQLYLSLRLSMINDITDEKLPIILDEAFVYYDDERLENILKYLFENYKDRQIIILTCANREEECMKKAGISYNKINL